MKRLSVLVLLTLLASILIFSMPALAITPTAKIINITNNGDLPLVAGAYISNFSTQALVDEGKLGADGLDAQLTGGADPLPVMLTNTKILTVASLSGFGTAQLHFTTDNAPVTSMPIIVGNLGYFTTADNVSLELGNTFTLTITAYFDTTFETSVHDYILDKDKAIRIYAYDNGSIRAAILDPTSGAEVCTATAVGVESGEHVLVVASDGSNLSITVDDGEPVISEESIGAGVPDNGNPYNWDLHNVMPYIWEIKIELGSGGEPGVGSPEQAMPAFIAYNNGKIYVPNYNDGSGKVYVMSASNMATIDTYTQTGNTEVWFYSASADASYLYLVYNDWDGDWLSKVRLSDMTQVDSVALQGELGVTIDGYINAEDPDYIYSVKSSYPYTLYKIAKADLSLADSVDLSGAEGWPATFAYDGTYIYITKTSEGNDSLIRINLSTFEEDLEPVALFDPDSGFDRMLQRGLSVVQDSSYVYVFGVDYDQSGPGLDNPVIYKISKSGWEITSVFDLASFAGYNLDGSDYWTMSINNGVLYCSLGNTGKTNKVALVTVDASNGTVLDSILYSEAGDVGTASGLYHDGAYAYLAEYVNGYNLYEISGSSDLVIEHIGQYGVGVSSELVEVLKYQPTSIIMGTALPDLDGNQDAVIHWGANSADMEFAVFEPPITPAVATPGSPGAGPGIGGGNVPIPKVNTGTWTLPSLNPPIIGDLINSILDHTVFGRAFFWYPVALLILLVVKFWAYRLTFSLFMKLLSGLVAVIALCAFNLLPWLGLPLLLIWDFTFMTHSQRGAI